MKNTKKSQPKTRELSIAEIHSMHQWCMMRYHQFKAQAEQTAIATQKEKFEKAAAYWMSKGIGFEQSMDAQVQAIEMVTQGTPPSKNGMSVSKGGAK